MKADLPKRVHEKHGAFYLVTGSGSARRWVKLSRVKEGMPALYLALGKVTSVDVMDDSMARVVADWLVDVGATHSVKTKANDAYMCREVAKAFVEFRASQVRAPHVVAFLKAFRDMPRTYNAYRSHMRELLRYAEERGWREPGSNPVDSLRTMTLVARNRYITDSELRRIKSAICRGADGLPTRSGKMICALVDMAYLTGQRISDLLDMDWSMLKSDGILFEPTKVAGSTGAKVLIQWSPKLLALVERIKALKRADITRYLFTTQHGQRLTYSGASSAWKRGVKRSGIKGVTFHDLKAKALTDVDELRGMHEAQKMGGHSTQTQTADYVRHKKAARTGATR